MCTMANNLELVAEMSMMSKSEGRIPEGRKKAETRRPKNRLTRVDSDFGLRISFGFRPSDFGLLLTTWLCFLISILLGVSEARAQPTPPPYRNPALPIAQRIED